MSPRPIVCWIFDFQLSCWVKLSFHIPNPQESQFYTTIPCFKDEFLWDGYVHVSVCLCVYASVYVGVEMEERRKVSYFSWYQEKIKEQPQSLGVKNKISQEFTKNFIKMKGYQGHQKFYQGFEFVLSRFSDESNPSWNLNHIMNNFVLGRRVTQKIPTV